MDYDERWPADFTRITNELRAVLGALLIAIEHVGSTSMAGLAKATSEFG
ncbi:MAG: GrpB family protein [Chthoniobacterales bacterium]